MAGQVTEIKKAARFSATKTSTNTYTGNLFAEVNRRITLKAIHLLKFELNYVDERGQSPLLCGCHQRRVFGLPCACELQMYQYTGQSIPVDSIDDYWKQISIDFSQMECTEPSEDADTYRADEELPTSCTADPTSVTVDTEEISAPPVVPKSSKGKNKWGIRMPSGFEHVMKALGMKKTESKRGAGRVAGISASQTSAMSISEEMGPTPSRMSTGTIVSSQNDPPSRLPRSASTSLPRRSKTGTSRRNRTFHLSNSPYEDELPHYMLSHIDTCTDVTGDGHCGFRAVAQEMYGREDAWPTVRQQLLAHLTEKSDLFVRLLGGGQEYFDALYRRIYYFQTPAPPENWMTMPDCGHVIASLYNVYVMTFSDIGGMTCPPAFVDTDRGAPERSIVLGNVQGRSHWILLHMKDENFPVPPINYFWTYHREFSAEGLERPLLDRIDTYIQLDELDRLSR